MAAVTRAFLIMALLFPALSQAEKRKWTWKGFYEYECVQGIRPGAPDVPLTQNGEILTPIHASPSLALMRKLAEDEANDWSRCIDEFRESLWANGLGEAGGLWNALWDEALRISWKAHESARSKSKRPVFLAGEPVRETPQSRALLKRELEALSSNCEAMETPWPRIPSLLLSAQILDDPAALEHLWATSRKSKRECIIGFYQRTLDLERKSCLSQTCKQAVDATARKLTRLLSRFTEYVPSRSSCPPGDASAPREWKENLEQLAACIPLQVGEEEERSVGVAMHLHSDRTGPVFIQSDLTPQLFKRTGIDSYEITLNPEFRTVARMRDFTQACLAKVSHRLFSPSGTRLKLTIAPPGAKRPKSFPIQVGGGIRRSHYAHWEDDISCEAVVHELLHRLGLPDEYKEGTSRVYWDSKAKDWKRAASAGGVPSNVGKTVAEANCRVLGPEDSLMSGYNEALSGFMGLGTGRGPAFYPAQMRHILMPDCPSANPTYWTCSRWAYFTDITDGGKCTQLPRECRNLSPEDYVK